MIPYARPDLDEDDIQAVVEVLRTEWLTQGPAQMRFENAIAKYCEVRYAVAVSSGTAALHLAYLALGLGPDQKIWTSPITFVATANAALYCGATVDFVDIDPRTYNLSPAVLEGKLDGNPNEQPAIVVPVHFGGQSCDMEEISRLARAARHRRCRRRVSRHRRDLPRAPDRLLPMVRCGRVEFPCRQDHYLRRGRHDPYESGRSL